MSTWSTLTGTRATYYCTGQMLAGAAGSYLSPLSHNHLVGRGAATLQSFVGRMQRG